MQNSRWGLTAAEQRGRITSLALLAMLGNLYLSILMMFMNGLFILEKKSFKITLNEGYYLKSNCTSLAS